MHAMFYFGNLKGRHHVGELGVAERVIFKWLFEECVLWNRLLALDRMEWLAHLKNAVDLRIRSTTRNYFLISERRLRPICVSVCIGPLK